MALDVSLPRSWSRPVVSLTIDNATRAKVLIDKQIAGAGGDSNLLGGARVIDGQIASTDGAAKSAVIWDGNELTLAANMGTSSMASTSTLTRTLGDYLADGWRGGDKFMIVHGPIGPYGGTAASYGTVLQVTAVTATQITVTGTPLAGGSEALQAGSRLVRVAQRTRLPIPINAGNADATPPVPLMTGTQNPSSAALPDTGWQLGPTDMVLVSLAAAASALPASIDFTAAIARY